MTGRDHDRAPVHLRVAGVILAALFRMLARTWRIRWHGDEHQLSATVDGPCIYALWHGTQLPLIAAFRPVRPAVLVSLSRDGTLLAEVLRRLGYRTVRGSSSREGRQGLARLEQELRAGHSVALAVDGPRGPARVPKPGVAWLARRTGRPVLPLSATGPGLTLSSWDHFRIPAPFARIVIRRGNPIKPLNFASLLETLKVELDRLADPKRPKKERRGPIWTGDIPVDGRSASPAMLLFLYRFAAHLLEAIAVPIWKTGVRAWDDSAEATGTSRSHDTDSAHPDRRVRLWFRYGQERLGDHPIGVANSTDRTTSAAPRLWFHAASLGEVRIAATAARAVQQHRPDAVCMLTVTSGSARQALAAGVAGSLFDVVRLAPFDLPGPVARTIDALSPAGVVLVETELWPIMLSSLHARRIPICLVNARCSSKSFRRYMRHRSLLAPLLHPVLVQPRTRIDAERFRALGVPAERCAHAADLKLLDDVDTGRTALLPPHLEAWFRRHRVLVAASTHPGEESIVLEAWRTVTRRFPDAGLLLAPRHPRRVAVDSVFEVLPRWRAVRDDSLKLGDSAVLVLDTLGDLRGLLGKAFAVLVGGTLVPGVGGHNLFEPALAGKPVLHGPHVENVADQALALERAGASVRVSSAPSLTTAWKMLLEDEQRVQNHGVAAKTCVTASTLEIAESLDRFVTRFLRSIVHEPTPKEKDGVPGPIPVA